MSSEPAPLELETTIGFGGSVPGGLQVHPDRENIVFALGCTVVIEQLGGKRNQKFLNGHTSPVNCLAVSPSGRYIASGQISHLGFVADIVLWDYKTLQEVNRFSLHKAEVHALAFSPNEKYLASLGGPDDGRVVVWDLEAGKALCGSSTAMQTGGVAEAVVFSNTDDNTFITGGSFTLRVWEIEPSSRKLRPTDVQLRALRRVVKCLAVTPDDEFVYCGTTTGDIVKVAIRPRVLKSTGPAKTKFTMGVHSLAVVRNGDLIVGGGDGTVALVKPETWRVLKTAKLEGCATSIALRGEGHEFLVGTDKANIYRFSFSDWKFNERTVSHDHGINAVAFPQGSSELFATCSKNEVNVWHTVSGKVLLNISVPNKECFCLAFMPDGHSILTGWDDGVIRAFTPETGKLKYEIINAHNKGVTAIAPTHDSNRIISGGGDGQVRIWQIGRQTQKLVENMKEHKGRVTSIKVKSNGLECVTSSVDGTCIIWDLNRFVRSQILFANTLFSQVLYRPDEAQVLTTGTDRKAGYWEVFDGSLIREMEISASGSVNGLDISPDGKHFVSGGTDKLLKIFSYAEGENTHVGLGHSGDINCIAICPNQKYIVSVSSDGAIFCWHYPEM